ncbi:MAG: peptidylprolyl isomerase [Chloroflexota bacterium]
MTKAQQPAPLSKKHQDRLHRERQQTRYIIIISIAVLVLVVGVILYGVLYENYFKYQRSVAVVNGENISAQDFRNYTKYYRYNLIQSAESSMQIAQMFGGDNTMLQQLLGQLQSISAQLEPETAAQSALNQMVDLTLIRQEAQRRGVTVTKQEVDKQLQAVMGYYPDGTPTPTNTALPMVTSTYSPAQAAMLKPTATATIEPTLAPTATLATVEPTAEVAPTDAAPTEVLPTPLPTATATPYTEAGFRSGYATMVADFDTNYEIPEETLRYIIEGNLYRERLTPMVITDTTCTEEQVWAQHILVSDPAIAKIVEEKAKAGEDWYALAAEYSTDESNKNEGGDLGWFSKARMVPEFSTAAFAMEVGQISEPVQTQFGYHIIRVLGHENRPLTTTECEQFKQQQLQDWLTKQRTGTNVELLPFWQQIFPLLPTLNPEIQQVIDNASRGVTP